jgi:GT2 family glycosyltransferase
MACHNRREHTLACLRALSQQTLDRDLAVEVYLLDDGSTDGTEEAVRAEFPQVHLLHGDGQLFWNRGMYESFSAAIRKGFAYYLWLNDDSILYKNALQTLLDTHSQLAGQGHECAIIGSAMQDPISGNFTYGGVRRYRSRWGRVKLERIPPGDRPIQCDASNGNCVLIPAAVVKKVGNLDPVYLHRWGDHDYCFRALQHGCTVWLAPGYLGACKENPVKGTWEDPSLPALDRIRQLNSPRGLQFHDYAIYMRRHRGPWWPAHLVWPYVKIALQAIKL